MPPTDGTNTIPLGVIAASDWASWPAPDGSSDRRQAELGGRAPRTRARTPSAVGAGSPRPTGSIVTVEPEALRLRSCARPTSARSSASSSRASSDAALEAERRAAGDDVERARLRRDVTDRGDAPGEVADRRLPHAEHEGRGSDRRIAPRVHRRRSGVPRLALERRP